MSTSLLYHTQGIQDFQHLSFEYSGKYLIWNIVRKADKFKCSVCLSSKAKVVRYHERDIRGLPMGNKILILRVRMHRIICPDCGANQVEVLPFLPFPKCHYTKKVAMCALELREEMTISAVAGHLHLHWCTVKEIEKSHLQRKYQKIDLKGIESIGIDEVYIGKTHRFLTIVRDLLSGRVLFVGEGKSSDCLAPFSKKLKRAKVKLKFLAIDLGNAYASWIKKDFPDCEIVYDHFHLIKLMNDKLTDVRRKTMNKLEEDERKVLKGKRFYSGEKYRKS